MALSIMPAKSDVASAQANDDVPRHVENAALAENWAQVVQLLHGVDMKTASQVLRLIKGHALLALNRSNESFALFASTLDDDSRERWQTWADTFAAKHPDEAIAWYFQGDAFARRKNWEAATKSFDRAIAINPKCYLALNARGVVSHAVGNTISARVYFQRATEAKADFADAYASRGTLNVYLNSEKASNAFEEAKRHSQDKNPELPLIGLGCTAYGKQEYNTARRYFDTVPATSDLSTLARRNSLATEFANLGRAVEKAEQVGTSLKRIEMQDTSGRKVVFQPRAEENRAQASFAKITGGKITIGIPGILCCEIEWERGKGGGKGGDKGGDKRGGKSVQSSMVLVRPELLPPLPSGIDFPDIGIPGSLPRRHAGNLPPLSLQNLRTLTAGVEGVVTRVNQQVTRTTQTPVRLTMSPGMEPGGADSDVSKVRANSGQWGVRNVYGLLYAIPDGSSEKSSETPARATGR